MKVMELRIFSIEICEPKYSVELTEHDDQNGIKQQEWLKVTKHIGQHYNEGRQCFEYSKEEESFDNEKDYYDTHQYFTSNMEWAI